MSDRIVTGLRLLRAAWEAQRELDEWQHMRGQFVDARWFEASDALKAAKRALDAFERGAEDDRQSKDWKLKQAGDHE